MKESTETIWPRNVDGDLPLAFSGITMAWAAGAGAAERRDHRRELLLGQVRLRHVLVLVLRDLDMH